MDHLHTLRRATPVFYSCLDPHCDFRDNKAFLVGKAVKCPFCASEFQLSREDLRRALPRCPNCSSSKKKKQLEKVEFAIRDIVEHEMGGKE